MKNLFKQALIIFMSLAMTSCLVDDDVISDANVDSANVMGFESSAENARISADGDVHPYQVNLRAVGPTISNLSGDITASISVDTDNSTAIAGVHYEALTQSSVTVNSSTNFLGSLNLNIITDGIVPPLVEAPYVILNIDTVSNGVIVNGKSQQVKININYLCFSDLAGEYVINFTSGPQPINIEQVSPGVYRADYFPTFSTVYWWEFQDVCGELTITDWQFQGGNPIFGSSSDMPMGTVDSATGDISFSGVNVTGVSWYVDYSWTILKVN